MDLSTYVNTLRHELAVAAEAGGDQARELAERLTGPLDSAARLVLLEALSAAADEITRDLAPGSVELRLRGRDPSFVVTAPPGEESFSTVPTAPTAPSTATTAPLPAEVEDGATSRINLRLPDALKLRVETAAGQQRQSVNAWLVRAAEAALQPAADLQPRRRSADGGDRFTGWVR